MQPQNTNPLDKKPTDGENSQPPSPDSQAADSSASPNTLSDQPMVVDTPTAEDAVVDNDNGVANPVVTPSPTSDHVAMADVPASTEPESPAQQFAGQPAAGLPPAESPQAPHMPAFMTPTSAQTGSIVSGSHTGEQITTPMNPTASPKKSKKPLFIAGLVSAFLLLLGGGFVFGFYIPGKPENVWKSAVENNGKLYDALTEYALEDHDVKGMKVDGSYDVKGAVNSSGTLTGQTVGSNGEFTGNVSVDGKKLGFDLRSVADKEGAVPNLYVRFTGLAALTQLMGGGGAQVSSPQLKAFFDNVSKQWYVLDGTTFSEPKQTDDKPDFTKTDVKQFLDKVGTVSKQYVFTADPDRAVLEVQETVGKEKKAGRDTYHYKVEINEGHLGQYLVALCNELKGDKLGKQMLEGAEDCDSYAKQTEGANDAGAMDVWVDRRTKLMHVVRVSDPGEAANYLEITQDYQGGDEFPLGLEFSAKTPTDKTVVKLNAVLNTKTNSFKLDGTIDQTGTSAKDSTSGSFSLSMVPSNETSLKVEKPANARPIMELVLGLVFMSMSAATEQASSAGSGSINFSSPSFNTSDLDGPTSSLSQSSLSQGGSSVGPSAGTGSDAGTSSGSVGSGSPGASVGGPSVQNP